MAHGSTVLLLCLAVGFLNLLMLGKAAAQRFGDPDDDSWSVADNIGLSGGGSGDWGASQVTAPAPSSAVASVGDDTKDADDPTEPEDEAPAAAGDGQTAGMTTDRFSKRDDLDNKEYGVGNGDGESSGGDGDYSSDENDFSSDDTDFSSGDSDFSSDDIDFSSDDIDFSSDDSDFSSDDSDFSSDDFSFDDSDFTYGKRHRGYSYDDIDYEDDESDYDYGRSNRYRYDDIDFDFDDGEDDDGVSRWRRRGSRSDYIYYDLDDIDDDDDDDLRRGRSRSRSGRRGGRRSKNTDYDFEDTDYGDGEDEFGIGFDRDFDVSDTDTDTDPDFDPGDYSQDDFDDAPQSTRRQSRRRDRGDTGERRSGRRGREPVAKVRVLSTERQATGSEDGRGDSVEIDDASATSEEIPSGYFRQAGGPISGGSGSGRCKGFASGSIDMPGFRLVISTPTEWWKHEKNVCLKKEFLRPSEIEMDETDTDMVVFTTTRCRETSMNEYSCNVTQWNGTAASAYRLTYTCCRGYTRMRKDNGCPRQILGKSTAVSEPFDALLRKHGYSQKIIDLFSTVLTTDTKKQWTVFVPSKEALDAALTKLDFRESKEDPVPELFVRTVLNHFVQPAILLRSLRHGQLLTTEAKSGAALLITKTRRGEVFVNCQPIVKADQPFNNYSLVHFTSSLLSIQQSSLFQLMLRRLEVEARLTPAIAGKLLAPIKALLTGAKSLTVFMHLPSAEEISNNCYARNLRSAIFYGVECNASMSSGNLLQSIDAKQTRLSRTENRTMIGGNRVVIGSDQLAANGVLHYVNVTESLIGFANELTRSLKAADLFKPVFARSGSAEGSLVLLIPPHNGSYSYTNTSARWSNASELALFGRQHLLDNATALTGLTGPTGSAKLPTLDGTQRDFLQLVVRQESAAIFGPDRFVRYRFVDCVRIVQTAKDCAGVSYFLLKGALPNFRTAPTVLEFLRGRKASNYTVVQKIIQFAMEESLLPELASRLTQADTALVLLKDPDMHLLSMGMLNRRRGPTDDQMKKLAAWFTRYFVASKQACAVKSVQPSLFVPVFQTERRPCRSVICAFRRRVQDQLKRVRLWPDNRVVVKEGFLLPGQVSV